MDFRFFLPHRSVEVLRDGLSRDQPGIFASYRLVGAVLTLGGLGYGLDRLTGSAPWFLIIGLLSGLGVGLYGIVKAAARR